jgi:hypothetical protein
MKYLEFAVKYVESLSSNDIFPSSSTNGVIKVHELLFGILRYVLESKNIFYTATVFTILQHMIDSLRNIYFLYFQKYQRKDILRLLTIVTIATSDHSIVEELLILIKELDLIYRFYQLLSNKRYLNASLSEAVFTVIEVFMNQIQEMKQKVMVKQQLGKIVNVRSELNVVSFIETSSSLPSVTEDQTILQKFVSLDLQYRQPQNTETVGEFNEVASGKLVHRRIMTICQQLIGQIKRAKVSASSSTSVPTNSSNQDVNKEKPKRNRKRLSSQESNSNKNKVQKTDQAQHVGQSSQCVVQTLALDVPPIPATAVESREDETVMV